MSASSALTVDNAEEKLNLSKYFISCDYGEMYASELRQALSTEKMISELYIFRVWTTHIGFKVFSHDLELSKCINNLIENLSEQGIDAIKQSQNTDIHKYFNNNYIGAMQARWKEYDAIFFDNMDNNLGASPLNATLSGYIVGDDVLNAMSLPVHYLAQFEAIKKQAVETGLMK